MESWSCLDFTGLAHILIDFLLLGFTSLAIIARWLRHESRLEYALLSITTVCLSLLIFIVQLAGYTGSFNSFGCTTILGLATLLAFSWRKHIPGLLTCWHSSWKALPMAARTWTLVFCAMLLLLAAINMASFPLAVDTLSYRLPRIGMWLQNGSIMHFSTGDERMNYTPHNAALIMSWIVGHFKWGYPGTGLIQNLGALLCLASITAFGRRLGLGTPSKVFGCLVFLLMPSSIVEMLNSETNMITAGLCLSYLILLEDDLRSDRITPSPWMAIALALGTKATVIYWLPGLGIITGYLLWHYARLSDLRKLARLSGWAASMFLLLGSSRFIQNTLVYGNPVAPTEAISRHKHGTTGKDAATPFLNLFSYGLIEVLPGNNPIELQPLFAQLKAPVSACLPDNDKGMYRPESRRASFDSMFNASTGGSITARGILPYLLAFIGLTVAIQKKQHPALCLSLVFLIAAWWASISFGQSWIPENTRYFILTNPLLAMLAMPVIQGTQRKLSIAITALAAYCALSATITIITKGFKVGHANLALRETYTEWQMHEFERKECAKNFRGKPLRILVLHNLYNITSGYFRNPMPVSVILAPESKFRDETEIHQLQEKLQCDAVYRMVD